jgi:hypothetical protein
MKCGTTSLFQYLGTHPEVLPSSPKQLNHFSDDARWARGLDAYLDHWPRSRGEEWLLEASPSYSYPDRAAEAAARIASLDADVRLVYLVRDPFERIESHWFHGRHRGEFADCASLGQALRTRPRLLDTTRYCRWIDAYRRHFGEDRFRVVPTAALDTDPAGVLAELCRFVGIDEHFEFPDLRTRYNTRETQLEDHPLVTRMQASGPLRRAVRRLLPLRLRQRLKLRMKPGAREVAPDRLSPEERAFVSEALSEDLRCLEAFATVRD